ncbi:MAG: TetR/AcrR family transcriptional regulator, partial [Pseudomonadota bacterium]
MARNTEERHAELRQTLIDLAEAQIQTSGVESLRARDLAKAAGCSVGAIYNVFQDMTGLVMAANVRTFERLGATVEQSLRDAPDDPTQQLIIMSQTYLAFAEGNRAAWRALFDLA